MIYGLVECVAHNFLKSYEDVLMVNGKHYQNMIIEFLYPLLDDIDPREVSFNRMIRLSLSTKQWSYCDRNSLVASFHKMVTRISH